MILEPAFHTYKQCRKKRHGAGAGSRLRALKSALCSYYISNGCFNSWHARFAYWLAFYGTPKLRKIKK